MDQRYKGCTGKANVIKLRATELKAIFSHNSLYRMIFSWTTKLSYKAL